LLVVDNSISMSDKQQLLRQALPDLLARVTESSVTDLHVGIVTSSLGDAGSDVACPSQPNNPKFKPDQVDMAHLMGSLERSSTRGNEQGFLAWQAGTPADALNTALADMIADVGEEGCGWEAPLESWYRFLVDPAPYRELARVACGNSASTAPNCVQPATAADGSVLLDDTLLAQRAAFLRSDSQLAIVMLSDENDCSAQVGDQTWVVFNVEDTRPMFRGSSVCATNPNDQCCYSCPLGPPEGCEVDPACAASEDRLQQQEDGQNLRCFDQKRRFGVDFLYPTARYVNALTQRQLCPGALDLAVSGCDTGELIDNPLFTSGRSPEQVFLTGIVGVPWQALATEQGAGQLRLGSHAELTSRGVWEQILGSPGLAYAAATDSTTERAGMPPVPPTLPQMVESPEQRAGVTAGNAINGRDYDTTQGTATQIGSPARADDLQYACIFPLAEPRDCAALDPNVDNCDCYQGVGDRPLCEATPGVSASGTTQYWGKAYPGLRQLQVLKDVGDQTQNSVVASICARNTTDEAQPDFAYRPAMAALMERLEAQPATE
jgi:hypothetical protein